MSNQSVERELLRILRDHLAIPHPPAPQTLRQRGRDLEDWAIRVAAVELLLRLPLASHRRSLDQLLDISETEGPAPNIAGPPGTPAISFTVTAKFGPGGPGNLTLRVFALVNGTSASAVITTYPQSPPVTIPGTIALTNAITTRAPSASPASAQPAPPRGAAARRRRH